MIASVYIKDGNICFYNEPGSLSGIGGIAYELGRPLLDFVCYEPERFDDAFSIIAETFDDEYAHLGAKEPEFISSLKEFLSEIQQKEVYVYFYAQVLMDFALSFADSPEAAITELEKTIPGAAEKRSWASDIEWLLPSHGRVYADKEKRLFRAVKDAVVLMSEHLRKFQSFIIHEIEVLLHYRGTIEVPTGRSIDYIDILDEYLTAIGGQAFYLEKPFQTYYGRVATKEVEQLYGITRIDDLFRFEFIKMIEHDIFIKKCKNCERFFIPRRRVDAEYCDRIFGDSNRKCSEIGAMLRYEKKVAEDPILVAYSKAYKRFNSRTRAKKMTQTEFLNWSEQARKLRDQCMAGELSFDEFVAWLEQGRVRRARGRS